MNDKIKVLIGDDSIEFGIECAGSLIEMGFAVITCQKDGSVVFDAIKNEQPDVVIANAVMPGLDAIELIKKSAQLTNKPLFIITSSYDNSFIETQIMNAGASYYMIRPFDYKIIGERIKSLLNIDSDKSFISCNNVEIAVTDIIHQIGVPAHIKGYHYLRQAIIFCVNDKEMLESVTKLLYPAVAKKFATTPSRVERAIRQAIDIAWDRGDIATLNSIFGITRNGKPTDLMFIELIADEVRSRMNIRD